MPNAPLDWNTLRDLSNASGPCISIILPPFIPGAQAPAGAAAISKKLLEQAQDALASRDLPRNEAEDLLNPLKRALGDSEATQGRRWPRILLRSPNAMQSFDLHSPQPARVCVSDRFDLLDLIPELETCGEFFILELSKKQIRLLRGPGLRAIPLPGGIPDTLDLFLELDIPDHDRENRAPAQGGSTARRVRFGTGTERERQSDYLRDYYRAIDRAMAETGSKNPLLLAGVDEDTQLYRSIAAYVNLIPKPIPGGSPNGTSQHELLDRSLELLKEHAIEAANTAFSEARERFAPARFSVEPENIVRLASEGRVEHLFLRTDPGGLHDLLNSAVVETIRHSGAVSVLPPDRLANPAAAALRY